MIKLDTDMHLQCSHVFPANPNGQIHEYSPLTSSGEPPFLHGEGQGLKLQLEIFRPLVASLINW